MSYVLVYGAHCSHDVSHWVVTVHTIREEMTMDEDEAEDKDDNNNDEEEEDVSHWVVTVHTIREEMIMSIAMMITKMIVRSFCC